MTANKKNPNLAKEWIQRAISDFNFAKAGEEETGEHHVACFLCHQAIEKTLKGLLVLANKVPPKIHNLVSLTSKVALIHPAFIIFRKDIRKIDAYYSPARYPDDIRIDFSEKDAQGALDMTQKLLKLAQETLITYQI